MLNLLTTYWWIALPLLALGAVLWLRAWAQSRFTSWAEGVLEEAQANFSSGNVEVHSVKSNGSSLVEGEVALNYQIDATIVPTDGQAQWSAADLFLRGIDDGGGENAVQIGEVRSAKLWNGQSFDPIKKNASQDGPQRLQLNVRLAGEPRRIRFNYNFACFGPIIELAESEAELVA